MPVAQLNNVATQATYVDALTVVFGRPRGSFTLHVSNAGVMYKLGYIYDGQTNTQDVQWETGEHALVPSLNSFKDPVSEQLPPGTHFAGVQLRSTVSTAPATVSVM